MTLVSWASCHHPRDHPIFCQMKHIRETATRVECQHEHGFVLREVFQARKKRFQVNVERATARVSEEGEIYFVLDHVAFAGFSKEPSEFFARLIYRCGSKCSRKLNEPPGSMIGSSGL